MLSVHEDIEKQIVSCVLQSGANLNSYVSLSPDCWSSETNLNIHASIRTLFEQGDSIDQMSVYQAMQATSTPLGFEALMKRCLDTVLIQSTFDQMCETLQELARQRRVVSAVSEAMVLAQEASGAFEAKQTAIGRLLEMDDISPDKSVHHGVDSLRAVIKGAQEAFEQDESEKDLPKGISTGFQSLDRILGGFRKQSCYIVGAGTSKGKSVLACNFGYEAARRGNGVLYCSLEMSHVDLMRRMLCSESNIAGNLIENGHLTSDQIDSLQAAARRVNDAAKKMIILDQPGLTLFQLGATVRQYVQSGQCDIVIVDYLQLLRTDATYSREREVAEISSSLCAIARANDIPVVALSQLNEEGKIRESRSVEHDAVGILKIKYPQHVLDEWDEDHDHVEGTIVVEKNRLGRVGKVPVMFSRPTSRFFEMVSSERRY